MATTTPEHDAQIEKVIFASIYPLYLSKIEKKGRTKAELDEVIMWLTGFDAQKLQELIDAKITYKTFFEEATMHPNSHLIL